MQQRRFPPPPTRFAPGQTSQPKAAPARPKHAPPPIRYGGTAATPKMARNGQGAVAQPYGAFAAGALVGLAGGLAAGPAGAWLGYEVGTGIATTVGLVTGGLAWLGLSSADDSGGTGTAAPQTVRTYAEDPSVRGGSYGAMKKLSKSGVREADHIPPKSTYVGPYYSGWAENDMPAVSISYATHRKGQSGGGGGVSTTGSSGVATAFRTGQIVVHMKAGHFVDAMIVAINDQKNAAANTLHLARGQTEAAEYARSVGLLKDDGELARVIEAINRLTY